MCTSLSTRECESLCRVAMFPHSRPSGRHLCVQRRRLQAFCRATRASPRSALATTLQTGSALNQTQLRLSLHRASRGDHPNHSLLQYSLNPLLSCPTTTICPTLSISLVLHASLLATHWLLPSTLHPLSSNHLRLGLDHSMTSTTSPTCCVTSTLPLQASGPILTHQYASSSRTTRLPTHPRTVATPSVLAPHRT